MQQGQNAYMQEQMSNIPNQSMMYAAFTPTFGNMNFMIQPASPGEVQAGFPSIPYMSPEALFYTAQSGNPAIAPTHVMTGSTAGNQNVQGSMTTTDQSGNIRVVIGNGQF